MSGLNSDGCCEFATSAAADANLQRPPGTRLVSRSHGGFGRQSSALGLGEGVAGYLVCISRRRKLGATVIFSSEHCLLDSSESSRGQALSEIA